MRLAGVFAELGADLVTVADVASEQQLLNVPLLFDSFETWPWTRKDTARVRKDIPVHEVRKRAFDFTPGARRSKATNCFDLPCRMFV